MGGASLLIKLKLVRISLINNKLLLIGLRTREIESARATRPKLLNLNGGQGRS